MRTARRAAREGQQAALGSMDGMDAHMAAAAGLPTRDAVLVERRERSRARAYQEQNEAMQLECDKLKVAHLGSDAARGLRQWRRTRAAAA